MPNGSHVLPKPFTIQNFSTNLKYFKYGIRVLHILGLVLNVTMYICYPNGSNIDINCLGNTNYFTPAL